MSNELKEKFTQGEWVAFDNFGYGWGVQICSDGGFQFHQNMKNQESNAHLIAAAPDMYRMLMQLTYNSSFFVNMPNEADEVEIILAKARGEQGDK